MKIVYLNGQYTPIEQAHVSVLDRGFLFGDGVYEVIPVFSGKLFRLKEHLLRLQNSLDAIDLPLTINEESWRNIFEELIKLNGGGDQSLYFQITRGAAATRDHAYTRSLTPTLFVMSTPLTYRTEAQLAIGCSVITAPDIRWQLCSVKAITLLPNLLMYQQAITQDCLEAIFIRDGLVVEGTGSNVFIVNDHKLLTPPLCKHMLGGITRDLILELAKQYHIPYAETVITETALYDADEIWITSSRKEIIPVLKVNDRQIGTGIAGPMWHKVIKLYYAYKQKLINE